MKTYVRSALLLAAFVASGASAASPPVEVTVRRTSGGQLMEKVMTDPSGNFALRQLPAGDYTLEFRCKNSSDLKNEQFTLTVSGTRQAGTQGGITGTNLVGGVALNVEMSPGAKVTGQIATGAYAGKKKNLYWAPQILGSNISGHWTENGSEVPAYNIVRLSPEVIRKMQDNAYPRNGGR
jgi:hypothetical protein